MTERITQQPEGRRLVQVGLTVAELAMVRSIATDKGISISDAIRRAIYIQNWAKRLLEEGGDNLALGIQNEEGRVVTSIPIRLLPIL